MRRLLVLAALLSACAAPAPKARFGSYVSVPGGALVPGVHADLLDVAKYQAQVLITFTNRLQVILDDQFETVPQTTSTVGTLFTLSTTTGSCALSAPSGTRGGVLQATTGATGSSQCIAQTATTAGPDTSLDDLIASTSKWYVASRWRFTTTPGANTTVNVGAWQNAGTSLGWGARGADGTTKFRLHKSAGVGVNSTISFDTNWHLTEMWSTGNTQVCGRVDSESPPVCFSPTWGTNATPRALTAANGATAAAQTVQVDRVIYIADTL